VRVLKNRSKRRRLAHRCGSAPAPPGSAGGREGSLGALERLSKGEQAILRAPTAFYTAQTRRRPAVVVAPVLGARFLSGPFLTSSAELHGDVRKATFFAKGFDAGNRSKRNGAGRADMIAFRVMAADENGRGSGAAVGPALLCCCSGPTPRTPR